MSSNLEDLKPALKTMLRAFGVGWSTTTAPALLTLLVKSIVSKKPGAIQRALTHTLPIILKKSVTQNGFPFLLAGAFGGHQFIQKLFDQAKHGVSQKRALFISAALSMFAVRRAFPNIKTLDLTFFVLVRAFDVLAHKMCASEIIREKVPSGVLEYGNVLVFMMACTEIMFSWFFEPERLPKSYARWITKMSDMNESLLKALRAIRLGDWVYGKDTGLGNLLADYCSELGLPASFGDPVSGRIDCTIVHEGYPYGCEVNALRRFTKGFIQVFPLYLSVHLFPPLFFRTSRLMQNPTGSLTHILFASVRSSTFLGSFIGIIWYCICLVRTRIGHQVLGLDQTLLDDTLGPLVGCMMCGLSLLIESKHRRGEMTLYVVPRALFSLTERILSPHQKGRWWEESVASGAETLAFAASVMVVMDGLFKDKSMVRPSIRGLMSWIMKDELKQKEERSDSEETDIEEEDEEDEKELDIKGKKLQFLAQKK